MQYKSRANRQLRFIGCFTPSRAAKRRRVAAFVAVRTRADERCLPLIAVAVFRGHVFLVAAIALGCQSANRFRMAGDNARFASSPSSSAAPRRTEARQTDASGARTQAGPTRAAEQSEIADGPEPAGVKAWVSSDACLEPEAVAATYRNGDERELWQALDFKPKGAIAGVVSTPAFEPPRALSLHRRRQGTYFFKLTKLDKKVWRRRPRYSCQAREGCQSWADRDSQWRAEASATKETFTRDIDAVTASLFVRGWKALLARAQVVDEIGINVGKFDGAAYQFWHDGTAGWIASPRTNSVLARAVLAIDWLEQSVENPVAGDAEDLALVRAELSDVLTRTRNQEPCLRPYED
jgi:hypothetical protein